MHKVNLKDAVADVQSVARMFRAVIALADAVDQVGDIQSEEKAATRDLNAAKKQLEGVKQDIDKAHSEHARVAETVVEAKKQAKDVAAKSEEKAAGIVAQATQQAADMVAGAQAEVNTLKAQATDTGKKLKAVAAEFDAKTAELAALDAQINKTKDGLRALVG